MTTYTVPAVPCPSSPSRFLWFLAGFGSFFGLSFIGYLVQNVGSGRAYYPFLSVLYDTLKAQGIDPGSAPQVQAQIAEVATALSYSPTDAQAVLDVAQSAHSMQDLEPVLRVMQARYAQAGNGS